MDRTVAMDDNGNADLRELQQSLARGDAMLAGIEPILSHLLSAPDHSLFSDEIVARVRGMLSDLAEQILWTQAEATGRRGRDAFAERHREALAEHFQRTPPLLLHCHALAIEWQVTERLEEELGLDPVLSPLLQRIVADTDPVRSSAGMAALTAQARFAQGQRRMELPLSELPGDLLHSTLLSWREYCGKAQGDAIARAETKLRQTYNESAGRLALFARLEAEHPGSEMLFLEDAGAGLFFTSLAARSGQSREQALLSSHARQTVRFVLGLRAAGLEPNRIDEALLLLHPGAAPYAALSQLDEASARDMLLDTDFHGGATTS